MKRSDITIWFDSTSLAADYTSTPIVIRGLDWFGIEFAWSSADASTGAIVVQGSISGSVWCDFDGTAYTLATANGDKLYNIEPQAMNYARIVYTHGLNTTGTMSSISTSVADRSGDAPGRGI